MTSIDENTWQKLTRPSGERLIARLAQPDICNYLFCALDSEGKRHLLIVIDNDETDYSDTQSRGIKVITRSLVVQGNELKRYIDLECLDESGNVIFNVIGGEIASNLSYQSQEPEFIVSRVLSKWRRFWDQIPKQLLSREEQIGLIAELLFLSKWLIPIEGTDAINTWQGPWGKRHDFEWQNKSVEVKATTNSRGRIYKIHGLSQLENPETGPLFLFSVRLSEEAGGSISLPTLVQECQKRLVESSDGISKLENGLINLGYSPIFNDEYEKLKLRLIEDVLFSVNGDFPKLTSQSFPLGLPSGIEQLEYVINLNTYNNLILSTVPIQF